MKRSLDNKNSEQHLLFVHVVCPLFVRFTISDLLVLDYFQQSIGKSNYLLWPITTDANNTMNQSELEANTCNRRQARENACEQVTIGFVLFLIG